jgi:2-keto-4-pentenoate hydratase/2-oxohepta-3-ene-1,7-dioic acid hydratase in catechol pathway
MRIARFVIDSAADSTPVYGVVHGDPGNEQVAVIKGDPFYQGVTPTGQTHSLEDVRLLAPIIPRSKVVGIGRNYADHAKELGNELPTEPAMFLVANTAVVGPGDPVVLPEWTEEVSYEGELCVVIGRICKDVPAEKADEVIFGYTVGNDLTARDKQRADVQWARAKSFDTSSPLGPWIETELDPEDLSLVTRLNGNVVQDGTTADMVFGVRELVAAVSQAFTLLPGDVIMTGTPAGVGLVTEGDRVEVEIEGIGTLSNPIVRR